MAAIKMVRVNWLTGVFLLCSVVLIGACGGSDSTDSTSTNDAPSSATASASGGASSTATSVPQATQASSSRAASSTATSAPQLTPTQENSSGGGGSLGIDEALDQLEEFYVQLLDVLSGVTDEASARAAVRELESITSGFDKVNEQMGDFSEQEFANAILTGRLSVFTEEITKEMMRISSDPAIFVLLAEAFQDLNPN